ncbi:exodeoxyribonuclease V subunit alpha [Buchnera aphidicola]|uniref:exodeoxyribonuclease V subunit alpha n=1 Tax=Buchnera aphidicola TaxID=9 RepID=UPI0034649956
MRSIDLYFALYIGQKQHNLIILAAALTSYAIGNGHICLPIKILKKNILNLEHVLLLKNKISNLIGPEKLWHEIFLKSDTIGNEFIIKPLILYNNCLYLYNTWKAEQSILNFLYQKNNIYIQNPIQYKKILNNLFQGDKKNFQKIAVAMAMMQKKLFIIGGPGTGKTTIIAKIIIALNKINLKPIKIKLAATTGQAASHLTQSLNNTLLQHSLKNNTKNLIYTATTIHKLIGIKSDCNRVKFHKKNTIDVDTLIIDESSMIDLFIMEKIIQALPKNAQVIFFGDINQLPAIGNGTILKDICCFAQNKFNKISNLLNLITNYNIKNNKNSNFINDHVCILKKNYRFNNNSGIHKLSLSLMNQDQKIFLKIKNNYFKNVKIYTINSQKKYIYMLNNIIKQYSIYWEKIFNQEPIKKIIKTFYEYRLIGAIRHGIFGIEDINKNIEKKMQKEGFIQYKIKNNYIDYLGKPIIITKNNKMLGLLNGDIGIMLYNHNNLEACFLSNNDKIKKIPINILPEYETAWAMTIHKSQGSEFLHTALILPNIMNLLLTKELLYTGITRSKKTLIIYSEKKILLQTMKQKTKRFSQISNNILKYQS